MTESKPKYCPVCAATAFPHEADTHFCRACQVQFAVWYRRHPVVFRAGRQTVSWLVLPWPPSANRVWRIREGRPRKSDALKIFKRNVDAIVLEAGSPKFDGPIEVMIAAFPPDHRKRRDVHNFHKATLDALEASNVFLDDSQVERLVIQKRPPEKPGRLVVTISELEPVV